MSEVCSFKFSYYKRQSYLISELKIVYLEKLRTNLILQTFGKKKKRNNKEVLDIKNTYQLVAESYISHYK